MTTDLTPYTIGSLVMSDVPERFRHGTIPAVLDEDEQDWLSCYEMLRAAETVEFVVAGNLSSNVTWNGFAFRLQAGVNRVPKPIYDVLVQAKQDDNDGWDTLDDDVEAAMHRKGQPSLREFQAELDKIAAKPTTLAAWVATYGQTYDW